MSCWPWPTPSRSPTSSKPAPRSSPGPYDIGLVEGSITTPHDAERIRQIRKQCQTLVTIGACATAGGIQALRNWANVDDFIKAVYATPEYISTLATSTPISDHVMVDFELRGCPINKRQLVELLVVAACRACDPGCRDTASAWSASGKRTVCVAVAQGVACLGPVTQAGCGAICPAFNRECFGCYGPKEQPNLVSLTGSYAATRRRSRPSPPPDAQLQRLRSRVPRRQQCTGTAASDLIHPVGPTEPSGPPRSDSLDPGRRSPRCQPIARSRSRRSPGSREKVRFMSSSTARRSSMSS